MIKNEFSKNSENTSSLLVRLYIYQKERFPLILHAILILAFSFSAVSYSRICRGEVGFIPSITFFIGFIVSYSLFMLVRIFDEHKDAEDDARFRKHLPVPRGVVSLKELGIIAVIILAIQLTLILLFIPKLLWFYLLVIGYLILMGKEFFIANWLKKHQFWYVTSHMFIIPLIDVFASGMDWLQEGVLPTNGLLFFFAVSYMNGIVLEIGRKIKSPEQESTGVLTYTSMIGTKTAGFLWLIVLFVTFVLSVLASQYAGYSKIGIFVLGSIFILCSLPGFLFLQKSTNKRSKWIEIASGTWTISMYLTLGAIPMLNALIE